jgi:hypothetical protein
LGSLAGKRGQTRLESRPESEARMAVFEYIKMFYGSVPLVVRT